MSPIPLPPSPISNEQKTNQLTSDTIISPVPSTSSNPSSLTSTSSHLNFDRRLLQQFDDITNELEILTQATKALQQVPDLLHLETQLLKTQRTAHTLRQIQSEILEKMDEKSEKSNLKQFFKFFAMNRRVKMDRLKYKLSEQIQESVDLEDEINQLERKKQSNTIMELRRTTCLNSSIETIEPEHEMDPSLLNLLEIQTMEDVQARKYALEKEKLVLLNKVATYLNVPKASQVTTCIAMHSSQVQSCLTILKQVDTCIEYYTTALSLIRQALATIVSEGYATQQNADSATIILTSFFDGPYIQAIEASRLLLAASHVIQPEAHRKYPFYAENTKKIDHLVKFPSTVTDLARRHNRSLAKVKSQDLIRKQNESSEHRQPSNRLLLTGPDAMAAYTKNATLQQHLSTIKEAEGIVYMIQRVVLQNLNHLEKWHKEVQDDYQRAEKECKRLEHHLEQQMRVLARSISV